jgi:TolB protein
MTWGQFDPDGTFVESGAVTPTTAVVAPRSAALARESASIAWPAAGRESAAGSSSRIAASRRLSLQRLLHCLSAAALVVVALALVAAPAQAAFPGTNGKIAFASQRDGNLEIYVMNADGSGQTRLTNNPANESKPAWSPDGSRIAFSSNRDGNAEIYVMNAGGSGQTRLTNNPALDVTPAWSPDGSRIAFSSDRDGNREIYVMNADGSGQTRLTNNPATDAEPAWSPDGSRIAFDSDRDGTGAEIYVMNAGGSGQTRLTTTASGTPPISVAPAWSPDGSRIAFWSNRDGNPEIYVMNACPDCDQKRLTNNPAHDVSPAWSPDGSKIAFDSGKNISVMNADGNGQGSLPNASGILPDWGVPTADHYQVELKAWIPMRHVVDPFQPITLPMPVLENPPFSFLQPLCLRLPGAQDASTLVSSSFRGDAHASLPGGFRVHVVVRFDWDGKKVSNFTVSPNSTNYGSTHLDFEFSSIANSGSVFASCSNSATAATSTFATSVGANGFELKYDSTNPMVTPQFAVPAIDGKVLGSFDANNDLRLRFRTDLFPSHGIEVTRNGVVQADAVVNDASCLDQNSVLGLSGISLLSYGLSSVEQNTGTVVVPQSAQGRVGLRSSPLCLASYDLLSVISGTGNGAPAADLGSSAAASSSIMVAPAKGGRFVSLAQAIRKGLVAGLQRGQVAQLLVNPAHPVRLKIRGRPVIVQETGLHKGRQKGAVRFGPVSGTLNLLVGKGLAARANGHKLRARKPDHKPPRTHATVTFKAGSAIVRVNATDASGVAETILVAGGRIVKLHHGTARIKRSQLRGARVYSIDLFGNRERPHRMR